MSSRLLALSLGTRIFLISGSLLVLALGSSVAATYLLGTRIADREARERIQASHSVQSAFQQQRYEQLQLLAQVFVANQDLRALLAEAAAIRDSATILDQLTERQADLGYDFAIVLDPNGRVLARSDDPNAAGADLSRRPLVEQAIAEYQASGVWQEGNRLYYAVAVPIAQQLNLIGYFVSGIAINDVLALEVKRISGTEVAFLAATPAGAGAVGTTLDGAFHERLVAALRLQGDLLNRVMRRGEAVEGVELSLQGRRWLALLAPLRDAAGQPVGATIALASLDKELASYRQIQYTLFGVGLAALVVALGLSYALSRATFTPVRRLAAAAEAARQGNYDVQIRVEGAAEVAQLAHAFDTLLADLRQKRDMEAYVTELSRNLPEPARAGAVAPAQVRKMVVLAIEMRRYANPRIGLEPGEALERLGRDLRRIATAVATRGGRIEAVFGHRVLVGFEGAARATQALAAAAEIARALATRESAFEEAEAPLLALASGEALTGSVVWADNPEQAVVGLPVQQAEGLLREASPGDILLSQGIHKELADSFADAGLELSPQRGLLSTQPLFLLSAEMAARATGVELAPPATSAASAAVPGARATLAEISPGSILGERFEILSVLGAGGMGVVYKARDRELDDLVALKMLKREVAGDQNLLERLKSELKLARKITHPNVLRTFDFGEVDGIAYISMEYVRGVTLRYLLEQSGRLPFSAGLRLGKQLCSGLGAAHGLGIIHRDIKPENLILDSTGNAKLMDFGLARPVQRLTPGQTQPGWIVGTPHYLAPEQLEGKEPDERADIYAAGVVLYEIFTGGLPFGGDTVMDIILQHLNQPPTPPRSRWREMPAALEQILLRCLEKSPKDRFASVAELQAALEGVSA